MKKIFFCSLCLVMLIIGGRAFAEESEPTSQEILEEIRAIEAEEALYSFPVIKPEVSLSGGYRFTELSGSTRAEEYEYFHDSLILGGELRLFSFPHRFHLEVDVINKKDYFGDLSYSFKDNILFRGINRTIYHNLDTISLIDLDPSSQSPGVNVRDSGELYGVKTGMNSAFLRLKMPDFPFHVYFDGGLIRREGSQQLRSLDIGSDIIRSSQSRDIDWKTKYFTVGANSHLGPVELDFAHGEKRFEAEGDKVFYDAYRTQGEFPRNLVPDLKSSSNTLKLHTSYTGGWVASASLSKTDKENRDSGATADYFVGAGEVVWTASKRLTVFVKYRHRDTDIDTPSQSVITDRTDPSQTYLFAVKPAISSSTDVVLGTVRYRPASGVTLRGEYSYEDINRDNAEIWNLPQSTQKNTASLTADIRFVKGLNFRAKYAHMEITDPAYNTDPDHYDEARLSMTWIPFPKLSALLSYVLIRDKRNNLFFEDTQEANNRKSKRDNFLGSVTFQALDNLSLTAGYSYMHRKITQDIAFSDTSGGTLTDTMVPNKDTSYNYSVDLNYLPKDFFNISAGVSYTQSKGAFYPASGELTLPLSIASFTELKARETLYSISGEYLFKKGFATSLQYKFSDFNDVLDNPYDDVNDGKAHIILLTLSKKW